MDRQNSGKMVLRRDGYRLPRHFRCVLRPVDCESSSRFGPMTWIVAAHGLVFFAWLVIFLVQTLLVQAGSVRAHRMLGTASIF